MYASLVLEDLGEFVVLVQLATVALPGAVHALFLARGKLLVTRIFGVVH